MMEVEALAVVRYVSASSCVWVEDRRVVTSATTKLNGMLSRMPSSLFQNMWCATQPAPASTSSSAHRRYVRYGNNKSL